MTRNSKSNEYQQQNKKEVIIVENKSYKLRNSLLKLRKIKDK